MYDEKDDKVFNLLASNSITDIVERGGDFGRSR